MFYFSNENNKFANYKLYTILTLCLSCRHSAVCCMGRWEESINYIQYRWRSMTKSRQHNHWCPGFVVTSRMVDNRNHGYSQHIKEHSVHDTCQQFINPGINNLGETTQQVNDSLYLSFFAASSLYDGIVCKFIQRYFYILSSC